MQSHFIFRQISSLIHALTATLWLLRYMTTGFKRWIFLCRVNHVANRANVSSHTVYQVLFTINHSSSNLGEAISIDEFKGNVGNEKYQTIVVDPIKHRVFDVLCSRKGTCLVDYFKSLDQSKHMKVQYFSCDMNKTFIDLSRI